MHSSQFDQASFTTGISYSSLAVSIWCCCERSVNWCLIKSRFFYSSFLGFLNEKTATRVNCFQEINSHLSSNICAPIIPRTHLKAVEPLYRKIDIRGNHSLRLLLCNYDSMYTFSDLNEENNAWYSWKYWRCCLRLLLCNNDSMYALSNLHEFPVTVACVFVLNYRARL